MSAAEMRFLPSGIKNTVTFEFSERQFTITGEVDRAGNIHEAHILVAYMDGPGQDPIPCTEAFRKSKYFMDKVADFVITFDWVSKKLAEKYSTDEKS